MSPTRESVHLLNDLLLGERRCCAGLAELVERERTAALEHDLEGLLATLREREDLQARWQRVAAARARVLADGPSLEERVARDPALATTLNELRRETAALRAAQRINARLLHAVLGNVEGLLAALRRLLPGARYDARATMTDDWPRRPVLHRSA